jgi:hypothetical protein
MTACSPRRHAKQSGFHESDETKGWRLVWLKVVNLWTALV